MIDVTFYSKDKEGKTLAMGAYKLPFVPRRKDIVIFSASRYRVKEVYISICGKEYRGVTCLVKRIKR